MNLGPVFSNFVNFRKFQKIGNPICKRRQKFVWMIRRRKEADATALLSLDKLRVNNWDYTGNYHCELRNIED